MSSIPVIPPPLAGWQQQNRKTPPLLRDFLSSVRGGTMGAKTNFLKVPKWILLWFQYIRPGKKEFLDLESILTLHIGPEFSHFWPKIAEKWPLGENAVAEYCQTF